MHTVLLNYDSNAIVQHGDIRDACNYSVRSLCAHVGFIQVGLVSHDMLHNRRCVKDLVQGVSDAISADSDQILRSGRDFRACISACRL